MPIEPINTTPISQFIQQVKSADSSNSKEVRLDIANAKNLAFTLGIVMARLNGDLEKFVKENASTSNDTITISMDGNNWN
jgi:hypothetical protein